MSVLSWLKGVLDKMLGRESIQQVLSVSPIVSDKMKEAIELWEEMYKGSAPWITGNTHSLGLPALIASEKARMATLEMEVKITGDNERAKYLKECYKQIEKQLRKQLEYGIALGGLVIKPYVVMGPNGKYKIKFTYTKASDFYPLSFSADGELTSAAFVDRIITKDKVYSKLEIYRLVANTVEIQNRVFESDYNPSQMRNGMSNMLGNEISIKSIPEWADIEPILVLNDTDTLLFAYFRNPEANTIDLDSPLGTSGYSRATNLIKEADEQYSNLLWEFEGGQLAVDVDRTAFIPKKDAAGRDTEVLPRLQERLFRHNLDLGDDYAYNVFSPTLRDSSILNGLNDILMHIEDACCLARGTISETNVTEARTATELKILKQRAYSANADVQKELQSTLDSLFHIVDMLCDIYEITPDGDYELAYKWDDSILVDKDSERQIDIVDVNNSLMSRVEYRMKWFGETEQQALDSLKIIDAEKKAQLELNQLVVNTDEPTTQKQEELDEKKRAQDSNEHNTEVNK